MIKPLFISAIAITLTACAANPPAPASIRNVAGPQPKHQQAVKSHMTGILKDPYSAKYTFTPPKLVDCQPNVFANDWVKVWKTQVTINAKNSFGAYIGSKPYDFWLAGGKVVGYQEHNFVYPNWCPVRLPKK